MVSFIGMSPFVFVLATGSILGLWNLFRQKKSLQVSDGLLILSCALLGARAGYGLLHLDYYRQQPFEIFQFAAGGLDGLGAFAGGLLAWGVCMLARRITPGQALDEAAGLQAPVALSVWLGCWLEDAAYGWPLPPESPWAALNWTGESHWPLALMASLVLLVFYSTLAWRWSKMESEGWYGSISLWGSLLVWWIVSLLRQDDPAPLWNLIRLDILLVGSLLVLSLAVCLPVLWRSERKAE